MANKIITTDTLSHFKSKYDTEIDTKIKNAVPSANVYATNSDIDSLFTNTTTTSH